MLLCVTARVTVRTCENHRLVHALGLAAQLSAQVHVEVRVGAGSQQETDDGVLTGADRHVQRRLCRLEVNRQRLEVRGQRSQVRGQVRPLVSG